MHIEFNWLAMIVAAAASFVVGFLWFGPLFGKKWAAEMGMEDMDPKMAAMAKPMVMNFIGNFLIAYGVSWFMAAGGTHWEGYHMALMPALLAWAGFNIPAHINEVAWQKRSWNLFGIHAGGSLVTLIVIASVLHWMG